MDRVRVVEQVLGRAMKVALMLVVGFGAGGVDAETGLEPDGVIGLWLNEEGTAIIELYRAGPGLEGKLVWLRRIHTGEVTDILDDKNPGESLRSRSLRGLVNLSGFRWNGERWDDGEIYDPTEGETYSAYLQQLSADRVKLRGFSGISLFGRSTEWTRVKALQEPGSTPPRTK